MYLVQPVDQFSNQVILKAEKPVVSPLNTSLPSPPFPVIFKGNPSHPQKFYAMHYFTQIFNTSQNPFNFINVSQSPVVHAEHIQAAAIKQTINNETNTITNIDKFSEHSQECKECSKLTQGQSNKEGAIAPIQDKGYIFPDPALLVYASAAQQSLFFCQWEHCQDPLIYRITLSFSNAKPLWPQLWHELFAMAFKSGNAQGMKAHDLMTQALGSALEAPSSRTTTLQAPAPVCNQPVDIEKGTYLVWELCKLNFCQELLCLICTSHI
ncbi:hypothetical protein EDD18DRAFT_1342815 [Armillaria luteobubalina]|uniref:Uncharacterized protein n=1 Tax=Armillaria luteobubalina TaxID=153913 RepID=A0AA39QRA7_9AGAR|nr:hypothetical protein EDD18DRAFT_1342815 [Armillaria luteobubalina]